MKSMSTDKYIRQFAPDGEHFINERGKVTVESALDWVHGMPVTEHLALFREAHARIVNTRTGEIVVTR